MSIRPGGPSKADLSGTYVSTLGLANGTDDTTVIQAALTAARAAGGGYVRGLPGQAYIISAPLVPSSNTTLDLTGCTITLKAGSNCNMVKNYAKANPVATASDGAITSGASVVTTALAAQAVVGQTLLVAGAGAQGNQVGVLTGVIASKTSTTVTLAKHSGAALTAGATVSGAAVTLITRDTAIHIKGGRWARGANGGTLFDLHNIFLRHIDGVTVDIEGGTSSAGKYMIGLGDVTRYRARAVDLNSASDGIHVTGPAYMGHIVEATGTSGDDLVGVTSNDYSNDADVSGDVVSLSIGPISVLNGLAHALIISAGPGGYIDGVRCYGSITGTATGGLVALGGTVTGNDGTYGTLDLGLLDGPPSAAAPELTINAGTFGTVRASVRHTSLAYNIAVKLGIVTQTTAVDMLDLYDCDIAGSGANTSGVEVLAGTTIKMLSLGCPRYTATARYSLVHINGGTVDECVIRDMYFLSSGLAGNAVVQDAGTIKRLKFFGGTITAAGSLFSGLSSAAAVVITVTGTEVASCSRFTIARSTMTVILNNPTITSPSNGALYTSSGTLTIIGSAILVSVTTFLQRQAGTETVRVNGASLPVDQTALTPSDGDLIYNNNATPGNGVGVAIYNTAAGKWKNVYSGVTN